ncbi:MAG: hypothetical protein WA140_00505 [Geobacteraceae bacterium]
MKSDDISRHIKCLRERIIPDGGFAALPDGDYRPDATAWAVLAMAAAGFSEAALTPSRSRLAADQLSNGGVSIAPGHPDAFWPTSLALLAWQGSESRRISYLAAAGKLGPIDEPAIEQRGEKIAAVRTDFALLDYIHAQRGIRLG